MIRLTRSTVLTGALSVAISLTAGCQSRVPGHDAAAPQAVAVRTCTVSASDTPKWLDATGTVSAQFTADISTRTPGRVTLIAVKEGDRIRKGQVLVSLDAADLDASVAQAGAEVRASAVQYQSAAVAANMAAATSAAQIESAKARVEQAEAALATESAKRDLVNAGPRQQERVAAAQNVAHADAALVLARKTYDRMATLYKNDAITGQQLDAAKSDLDGAQAAYQSALQQQSMTDEGSRAEDKAAADAAVAQAKAGLDAARAGLVQAQAEALVVSVRHADMRQAQAQIGRAKAALGAAVANRSYSTIVAPFDGVVAQRLADPGAMAGPGVPLLKIQGGELRLDAVVPESALAAIHVGATLPISLDALGGKPSSATIISISPQGDAASHTFVVKARLPYDVNARAGMFGRARIRTGLDHRLTVPASAVVSRDGLSYVYVVQNKVARLRLISTGTAAGERVAVTSGLTRGEAVAMTNVDKLTDNASIEETK
ncbi:MAG: efflux RND transporter periplasmic adaptor subunit [Capsulimonadaceae bacterium]|nr:efflux RND transporter periplasmic adaptor subunit [Capsulimonadaceae bacterium]